MTSLRIKPLTFQLVAECYEVINYTGSVPGYMFWKQKFLNDKSKSSKFVHVAAMKVAIILCSSQHNIFPTGFTIMLAIVGFCNGLTLLGRLCGLVVRVLGYRSRGQGLIPGTTRKKKSSGSGTGSTQPREYN
jgi:hypothetical protein